MASEQRRAGRMALVAVTAATLAAVVRPAPAAAAGAWWSPAGLQGTSIAGVAVSGSAITVRTAAGATLRSTDQGAHFTALPGNPALPPLGTVVSVGDTWAIDPTGRVLVSVNGGPAVPDPGAPHLGAGARLIAAPAALPGVVVAVATDSTVWRRGQDGDWQRALLLLPQSLVQGAPHVTAVTAFTQPLSTTVYLGTDGYAVLDSTNGGDDWIRAGPGLPDAVHALAADSTTHSVYAATSDGLWVHVLQALPSPPAYHDAALVWRWVGIGGVTAVASVLAVLGLLLALRRSRLAPQRPRVP